ncbi:hypothetical protein [Parabacteroides goldsteinii]|uniref:hypothetical protein n=1 Tax=Parabacteroides goldsteinii TaxID=328812 RepID=UPI001D533BC0|nr:hypothetical protein [Parabacteroides goldsteinii]MBS6574694.1 hypothetical protein [Parabacteroides goldsteinii]
MSYRMDYVISVDHEEKLDDVFDFLNTESTESGEFEFDGSEIILNDNSWNCEETDLKKLSLNFPEVVITVFREDSGNSAKDYCYYKNGKVQYAPLQEVYDEYDESKLVDIS